MLGYLLKRVTAGVATLFFLVLVTASLITDYSSLVILSERRYAVI